MSPHNDSKALPFLSAIKLALTTRKLRSEIAGVDYLASEPIAIVGMACRFPGGATSPEQFWDVLDRGVDAIREVPLERWDVDAYFDADPGAPGKIRTRWGGFLDHIDLFDAEFFGIAPREAARMDPQQRLLLEVTWEALDDAGYPPQRLAGSLTGVYLAAYNSDYARMLYNDIAAIDAHTSSGTAHSISSGRIAYLLDLKGPCLTVDTACSSSLVAVHLAVQALRQGGCRTALAGGVSLVLSPEQTISLSKWGMLAPDGRCKAFDARANGFIRGEGCGMVVLKRLSDALEDDDRILAIIRGTAVNHDGRSIALTAPNGLSQEAVIRQALQNACVDPSRVSYIEAHGTGTALGDPIEVEALKNVFGGPRLNGDHCLLGSVKTNIGHLEAAAGIAGLIKVALSLQHEKIPPHLHFKKLNPMISLAQSCLSIKPEGCQWLAGPQARFAGISSFGFGGTNAHVIIEESPRLRSASSDENKTFLLPISARTAEGLQRAAMSYRSYLEKGPGRRYRLRDICYTAAVLRSHHKRRLAISASSHDQMVAGLSQFLDGDSHLAQMPNRRRRVRIGFVFSGQGGHWLGMGRDLLQHDALFDDPLTRCDQWLRQHAGWSAIEVIDNESYWSKLQRTDILQPVLFALQVALAYRLQAWGLNPDAVVGHSIGEVAAACVGGVLSLVQALEVVVNRSRLMQRAAGQGMMASVAVDYDKAREMIRDYGDRISVAAVNAPRAVTLSGEKELLRSLLKHFDPEGRSHRVLPVDCAFHSAQMAPFQTELTKIIGTLTPRSSKVPFYSTVTGGRVEGQDLDAAYWGRNLREPVAFESAILAMAEIECEIFVEIGPHPILLPFIAQILETSGQKAVLSPTLRRNRPGRESLLDAVAALYMHGCEIDWAALSEEKGSCVSLPNYPWQRERYWAATKSTAAIAAKAEGENIPWHPLLGDRLRSPFVKGIAYRSVIGPAIQRFLNEHQLLGHCVVPGAAVLEMAMAAAMDAFRTGRRTSRATEAGATLLTITNVSIHETLVLEKGDTRELQFGLDAKGDMKAAFRLFSCASEPDKWTLHAQGTICHGADRGETNGDAWPASLEVVRSECTVKGDVESHYDRFRKRGVSFGPAFKGIIEIWTGGSAALACVEQTDQLATSEGYLIHPAYLDAWLQVLGALLPVPGEAGDGDSVFLPIALERLEIFEKPVGRVWCCGRFVRGTIQSGQLDGEIAVFEENGDRVAQISGLRLMKIDREKLMRNKALAVNDFMYEIEWKPMSLEIGDNEKDNNNAILIVLGCDSAVGAELVRQAEKSGLRCVAVSSGETFEDHNGSHYRVDPMKLADFQRLFDSLELSAEAAELRIVHLFGLENQVENFSVDFSPSETQRLSCGSALHMVQALVGRARQQRASVWLVAQGSRFVPERSGAVDAFQAPLWGLGGVIAQEHPELNCTRIDIDALCGSTENAALILQEISLDKAGEAEIAFRQGVRFVPRLAPWRSDQQAPASSDTISSLFVLKAAGDGVIDNLAFFPENRRQPGRHEIEIAVEAVGLNFRDVLNALKMLPDSDFPLGGECAGRVVAVGEEVEDLQVGDEVLAFALGAFRSHVTVRRDLVYPKPAGMSFATAASIPVVFLTASYALHHLSNIAEGDTILIHAATGGVGLAAVQIAQAAGAEIFATAGNSEKRDYLRSLGVQHIMDSRSVDFAEKILEQTRGRGVDFVLNSLSGEMIPKSLSVVRAGGTFFEIGKRDIWDKRDVADYRPGIVYHVFDMAAVADETPTIIQTLLHALMKQFASNRLKPLKSTLFDKDQITEAFRTMARAKHIGKIVVLMNKDEAIKRRALNKTADKSGTHLITGGLGALGIVAAHWLIEKGACQIALAGRHAPDEQVRSKLEALKKIGVQVNVFKADVTDMADTRRLLAEINASMPQICSIVHAAGVIDDGALLKLDWPRFRSVLAPKIDGAWNLHRLTQHLNLNFFMCFSSAAAVLGWPGQGNYAAANAFLDALMLQRKNEGASGLSINWGPWAEGGMAANLSESRRDNFSEMGMKPIASELGMACLGRMLGAGGQIIVLPVDWERFRRHWGDGVNQPFFEKFARGSRWEGIRKDVLLSSGTLNEVLGKTPPGNRLTVFMDQLERQAVRVLGLPPGKRIEPLRPLKEIGLDSLMAVELRNALNSLLEIPLPATLLFDYPSLQDLARYLAKRIPILKMDQPSEDGMVPIEEALPPSSDLLEMSDKEAEALLLSEIRRLEEKQNG